MLKWLHQGCSEFSGQLDVIDFKCKYILMQKMAFLSIPNFAAMMHEFLGTIFLCQFPESFFDCNHILITMKKDVFVNFNTFQ